MKYLLMFIALCFCVGIAYLAYTLSLPAGTAGTTKNKILLKSA